MIRLYIAFLKSKSNYYDYFILQFQLMAIGPLGANGPRAPRPAVVVSCQGAEHALIQPLRMEAVRVQGPLLSHNLVTPLHAKVVKLTVVSTCF